MATSTPTVMRPIKTIEDYYKVVMDQNAEVGEGLLCRLVPGCPGGDFAHTPYTWTKPQQLAWKLFRQESCHVKNLPGNPKMMLQSFHIPTEKDRSRKQTSTIVNIIATGDVSTDCNSETLPTTDLRISKAMFLRLEQIASPGIRIWLMEPDPYHFLAMPSDIFKFTDEEKQKYRENKFKEDGSHLPTLEGLVQRYKSSGIGQIKGGLQSASNGVDAMQKFYEHFTEQDAKTEKNMAKETK